MKAFVRQTGPDELVLPTAVYIHSAEKRCQHLLSEAAKQQSLLQKPARAHARSQMKHIFNTSAGLISLPLRSFLRAAAANRYLYRLALFSPCAGSRRGQELLPDDAA